MSDSVQYLTAAGSERTEALRSIATYQRLLEELAARREEPTIRHYQFISELKRDGLV